METRQTVDVDIYQLQLLLLRWHISTRFSSSSSGSIFSTSLPGIKVQQRRFPIFDISFSWWTEILLSLESHILVKSWLGPGQVESVGSGARNCLWLVRPFGQHVAGALRCPSVSLPLWHFRYFLGSLLGPLAQISGGTAALILYYVIIQNTTGSVNKPASEEQPGEVCVSGLQLGPPLVTCLPGSWRECGPWQRSRSRRWPGWKIWAENRNLSL